jgi:hypothetical protein
MLMGPAVPNLQGLFLRGRGSQDFNSGGKGNVSHASGALGQIQGDTIREMTGKGSFAILSNGYDGLTHSMTGVFSKGPRTGTSRTINMGSYYGAGSETIELNISNRVPVSSENRPVNMAGRYLIRAAK